MEVSNFPKILGKKGFFPLLMCESLGIRLGESGEPE